jgi:hypothetical protein
MYLAMTGVWAELPLEMSAEVKSLIVRYWSGDPEKRPSLSDILKDLQQIDFKLLLDVNSGEMTRFFNEVRRQENKK